MNSLLPCHCLLKRWLALWFFIALMSVVTTVQAAQRKQSDTDVIHAFLKLPDDQIDLAKVQMTIDHMIDPSVDIARGLQQLDTMANEVRAKLPLNASSRHKLEALKTYLYQAGPWNGNNPFRYNLDDPFVRHVNSKLLTTYLSTHKGNCVSMPVLFVILGQKIGLDVTLSTAPEHVFVKYRDETGTLYNLEATSGAGFTRDAWMRQQMPMTDQALANGIYMQPLSKKESVVVMTTRLMEFYGYKGWEEQRIAMAKLALKYYPKSVDAMMHIGGANAGLRVKYFESKYPTPNDIPLEERGHFVELERNMKLWRAKAEALGWREPDFAYYRQTVEREKLAQQKKERQ